MFSGMTLYLLYVSERVSRWSDMADSVNLYNSQGFFYTRNPKVMRRGVKTEALRAGDGPSFPLKRSLETSTRVAR